MGSLFRLPPAGSVEYRSPLVLLFGFLFLAAGCVMLLRVPYLFYQKGRLDKGLEVPARILRVESVSSGGGRHSSVSVEYEFRWGDSVFKGDRASVFSESNGLYFRLREAFESGREVTCFVDPGDPRLSALEKDVRVMDLIGYFGLGTPFAIVGSLYLVRSIGVSGRKKSAEAVPPNA
ncbi:MAG: DUF3592 domain-containing protein [Verrucomicrobia bacterium]|nr:DUF3592 domain-containing protein [Verrucomicrobiota bacterium]